jgi:O-acetylhomoserine (thiol)-lyase
MKLESIALHHGYESEATTKAAAVPIYQTTSYTFDDTQGKIVLLLNYSDI